MENIRRLGQIKDITVSAADLLMGHEWKVWFWGDCIGVEGLLDASQCSGEKKYEAFVYGLVKAWLAHRHPPRSLDYTAPGVALLRLYKSTDDPVLLRASRDHAEYLAGFRQTEFGAYVRYENPEFDLPPELPKHEHDATSSLKTRSGGPCVFVDNMHFDGPFFARLYQITREPRYRDLAVGNILPSIQLLFDQRCHLFHHFWSERLKLPNGVFWGRGQGWAMLGIVHTLEHLPEEDPAVPQAFESFTAAERGNGRSAGPFGPLAYSYHRS